MSQAFRLGLFIVAGLAVLVAGVFLIGSRESLFQSTYHSRPNFRTSPAWLTAPTCGWAGCTKAP